MTIISDLVNGLISNIDLIKPYHISGIVVSVRGLLLECRGLSDFVSIGSRCKVIKRDGNLMDLEVVGISGDIARMMAYGHVEGVGVGCKVMYETDRSCITPSLSWKGRILNAKGEAVDSKGPLMQGEVPYFLKNSPISAHERKKVDEKMDLGVKVINLFTSCCIGQRLGIFAGSGVGKSVLISMLAKYAKADVKVIGLIGERGRELSEFINEYLGEDGLKESVIVVATSDELALVRKQAAYLTMAIAEFYRDQGMSVLCIMDSMTRFAMAQREIGLSSGEPPSTKGYTPSVFAELPQLLERAGPGKKDTTGSITGLFTILVEGDDHNEPISDAVRGILDGHVVLDRALADRGIFPAVNILRSISRTMPRCNSDEENAIIRKAKSYVSTYYDIAEMVRLGAYKRGSDAAVDLALQYYPKIEEFLKQDPGESETMAESYQKLNEILA